MFFDPLAACAPQTVRFLLMADPEPGLLPRLLAPFARRGLIPDLVLARRAGDALAVEIAMDAMPGEMLHLVEGNLRQVVGLRSVTREAGQAVAMAA
jgi:hypothetical protein